MERSIKVKADTIEEAVHLGLSILDVKLEEVDIEVLTNPGRSLFGLRKNVAEVRVSTSANQILDGGKGIHSFINGLSEESALTDNKVYLGSKSLPVVATMVKEVGSRIHNKKVELSFTEKDYPVIEPSPNVRLFINDKEVIGSVVVAPEDVVTVKVSDEIIPPTFSINLVEHDMLATLSFSPGKIVKRTLEDTNYEKTLRIEATEEIEFYNDINPQSIVDELKLLGVQKGLIFPMIKRMTEVQEEVEEVIAKGVQPVEGLDGDVVIHVGLEEEAFDELIPIDFRETSKLVTVSAGEIIGTYRSAVPGKDGLDLFGEKVEAKKVKEIIIRTGPNVEMIENDIVATIAGKPLIEWRSKLVNFDVHKELVHNGEVDLESGNIRFEGDIRIGGDIRPTMFVGASGSIYVGGAVTKATIHSAKGVTVKKNVFSTTISVGKQNYLLGELADKLEEIFDYLTLLHSAVTQVLLVRGEEKDKLSATELNHLILLLLEKRYTTFQEINKSFIQKVKNNSMDLSSDWVSFADKLYNIFINTRSLELKDLFDFELIIQEAGELVELYKVVPEPKSLLSLPYAINSELYCIGNIIITSKGLYNSSVTAGNNISVKGVCRGGEIIAGNKVILEESGSENTVKMVIRTGVEGSISIGHAYAGTEIYIGTKRYVFKEDRLNVFAELDENHNISFVTTTQ